MSSGKGGSAPDARETIGQQTQSNMATAWLSSVMNRPNQVTPYGTTTYTPVEGGQTTNISIPWGVNNFERREVPLEYTVEQTLSPNQQRIFDLTEQAQMGLGEIGTGQLGNIKNALSSPLDFGQFGAVPGSEQAGGLSALGSALMERQQPLLDRRRAQIENQLANQGITRGSEAWGNAQDDLSRSENDAYMSAVLAGNQEQQRALQARQQQISELLQQRSIPINEITALVGGNQVTLPAQAGAPLAQTQIAPTDVATARAMEYQGDLNKMQGQQGLLGGMFGLGGSLGSAAIMSSDRRLKRNIKRIGEMNGLPLYSFRYVWGGRHVGFMADEVAELRPDAVLDLPGGFKAVDYERAMV